jgi:hypothetical protein
MRTRNLPVIAAMAFALVACKDEAPHTVVDPPPASTPSSPDAAATAEAPTEAPATAPTTAEATARPGDDHAAVNERIDSVLGDHAKYEQVAMAFQSAVANGDRTAVAALVAYPFTAHVGGGKVAIADADAFVARYDDIVTPAIAEAIARQKYADLFVNAKGVMFGNGEAWINGICNDAACSDSDVRVVAIQSAQP